MKTHHLLITLALFFGVAANGSTDVRAQGRKAPAAVEGRYKYETPNVGETVGYLNYLAVDDKGEGRLVVYISAASIYDVGGGAQSSHEANVVGEVTLRGNTAKVEIAVEHWERGVGSSCPVTITFAPGRATVKAAGCSFGVSIDGVYEKEPAGPKGEEENYVPHFEFNDLLNFIDGENSDPPKPGEEFVVEGVPMIDKLGRSYGHGGKVFKGFYWLTADINSDVVTSFYAATDLAEALRPKLSTRPHHLRVECILVEVSDVMEEYRSAFATAVEAVDADGKTLWRVTGSKPKSVKIRY